MSDYDKEFTLEMATKEELWKELSSRFHSCVLLCEGTGDEIGATGVQLSGTAPSITGLLQFAASLAVPFTHQHAARLFQMFCNPEGDLPNGQED